MRNTKKQNKGITMIALIVTIVILLILAGITIPNITGENSLINRARYAKERSDIDDERTIVEISATQAMESQKRGKLSKLGLEKKLDGNTKTNATEVEEDEIEEAFFVKFLESTRIYKVNKDGNVEYIGKEAELANTAKISADPESNTTPQLVQNVDIAVTTGIIISDENIALKYCWSTSNTEEPENYTTQALTGTQRRTRTASITSVDTEQGDYYLWTKVEVGEGVVKKCLGPYAIKDHTTLKSCLNEQNSTSSFLGNSALQRNAIKSVTLVNSIEGHSISDENCWDASQSQNGKILGWYTQDANGYFDVTIGQNGGIVANADSSRLFEYIGHGVSGELVTINGLENLDTGLATNMSEMFYYCKISTDLNLCGFNTSNVKSMVQMFMWCDKLTNLNVSNFDTSNVKNMGYIFCECTSLKSLDVSNFNTSNVENMEDMFRYCSKVTTLDVSNLNTTKVKNMNAMFYGLQVTSLDVSKFDTSNVENMKEMFTGCSNLTNLDVGNFNTTKVKDMSGMFYNLQVTSLDVSKLDTSNVESMKEMFKGCRKLTKLDVSKFDTKNVENMNSLFYNCSGLTELNVSTFATSNVKDMGGLFYGCSSLTNLDVSTLITSNVTKMRAMFYKCNSLTELKLDGIDTNNVTDMGSMFSNCNSLSNLDVSKFNTSKVTDMSGMFTNSLTNLNLSNFNTSEVTDMSYMFSYNKLTSIDVSNFDTSKVTNMSGMFNSCSSLKNIDLSVFNTIKLINTYQMFYLCSNLDSLNIANFKTDNVTVLQRMFNGVPTTVSIITNSATKTWLNTNFPTYTNITVVDPET